MTVSCFWISTTVDEKYALERNVLARARSALYMTAGKMELHVDGQMRKLDVSQVAELTAEMAADGWRKLRNSALFGALSAI